MVHGSHTEKDILMHLGQFLNDKKSLVSNIFYHFLLAVPLGNWASKMSEKFRLGRKIGFQNTLYTKCINVIIDSVGPSIILRSICALWSPAGKGLTSWLSFVVSTVSLSLSHWYPGSGVVLDCIDS